MKILVTGGAGFIGSEFIRYTLSNDLADLIVNYDKLTYAGNLANLKSIENDQRYNFVKGDICDKNLLKKTVEEFAVDTIVHFAAETHVDRSIMDSLTFLETNVIGTQVILEIVREFDLRFHHISTDEVFGSLGSSDPAFCETTSYDPRSPYSASKASSDHLVRAYFHTHGIKMTISNCSNNYGPYLFPEKLMSLFITNLIEGKKVPLYGDGRQIRDWLYVTDHVEAIWEILKKGRIGETYCIGGESEKTNLEVTMKILKLLNKDESSIEYVEDRKGHDRRYAMDITKIKKELGWSPKILFDLGMKMMVDWYVENQDWWKKIKTGEYLDYYNKQYGK